MIADQIVAALIESDDFDPKDYAMTNLSVLGILDAAGFKKSEDKAQTYYLYIPVKREIKHAGRPVTALLLIATWHPPLDSTRNPLDRILQDGMIHLTWQFVQQPEGWEAGSPVGRRMSFNRYGEDEQDLALTLQRALKVIDRVVTSGGGVARNMASDSYHAAIKTGLVMLGDVNNEDY